MRIAIAQIELTPSLECNTTEVLDTLERAEQAGADIVLFPECVLTGYLGFERLTLDDLDPVAVHDAVMRVQQQCMHRSIGAVIGQYFKRCGRWYNNAVAIGRRGELLASYDKLQLVDRDCYEVAPGECSAVFEFDGARCSMAICHDIRYPEVLRQYGNVGVQVHFHLFYGGRSPGAQARHYQAQYDAHLVTRAVENGFFLAAANAARNEQMVRSQARDCEGRGLQIAQGPGAELLFVDVDPAQAGDGWAAKRRDDLFPDAPSSPLRSYFERSVWEHKGYMIRHDKKLSPE